VLADGNMTMDEVYHRLLKISNSAHAGKSALEQVKPAQAQTETNAVADKEN
jgi:hypothetical protein